MQRLRNCEVRSHRRRDQAEVEGKRVSGDGPLIAWQEAVAGVYARGVKRVAPALFKRQSEKPTGL